MEAGQVTHLVTPNVSWRVTKRQARATCECSRNFRKPEPSEVPS
ncbi:hypothetical protein AKJ09_07897 [Labilithrix luteola]|uniref:Uncharacterized protein n=1 Tax=Labilithrix luteola TaxID=1391654 RepID=A0A0K1Q698_9BACT|nr:hypothetical protein AKJ09_07897 [Labilithrix luteola]